MSGSKQQDLVAKLVGTAAALAAAWLAQKLIAETWKARTGHEPPRADDEGDHGLTELVAATALTGAIVGVARVLATRGAAKLTSNDGA
ncbi:DUF4235 domain-containing protein [Cellulomonas edaphi]|uniref:DUF4235 domain-containing protein n=1 Tax=Cellulomonas edaphi TaxID=3053468 RepID=A0ABT7S2V1_9CELL|nr:DUF4235 domain-containing protein [Cellulomons edaphi]MDM7829947.1 DUF4235 domain-containing protein [Cellulomons edaphi]